MKDLFELFKDTKFNSIPRDLFYIFLGFLYLLISNFVFKPDIKSYPNFSELNSTLKILSIIVSSYFFTILLIEIGDFFENIFKFLFRDNKIDIIKEYLSKIKKHTINKLPAPIKESKSVSHFELDSFILKEIGYSFGERNIQLRITKITSLGFCFILSLFYSPYFFILSFILLISNIQTELSIFESRLKIAQYYNKSNK